MKASLSSQLKQWTGILGYGNPQTELQNESPQC